MDLIDYIGGTLCPDLVEAVQSGARGRAVRALAAAHAAARETGPAHKLYAVNLSLQFDASPKAE